MVRCDKLIRRSMTVRDVRQQYPHSRSIFEESGFLEICDECSIEVVRKRQVAPTYQIIDALNSAFVAGGSSRE
jgi:hypothetical protein